MSVCFRLDQVGTTMQQQRIYYGLIDISQTFIRDVTLCNISGVIRNEQLPAYSALIVIYSSVAPLLLQQHGWLSDL